MENATKALLMAATVLIGIMIVSLGVYLFIYFSDYAKGVEDENKLNQIAQFNSQFLSYQGKELTFYDVISIANMANDYNKANNFKKNNLGYITVNISSYAGKIAAISNFESEQDFKISENSSYIYLDTEKGTLRNYILNSYNINTETKYVDRIELKNTN